MQTGVPRNTYNDSEAARCEGSKFEVVGRGVYGVENVMV